MGYSREQSSCAFSRYFDGSTISDDNVAVLTRLEGRFAGIHFGRDLINQHLRRKLTSQKSYEGSMLHGSSVH